MVVPPKRNHRTGLVSSERVAKRDPRGGLIRRLGRRRTPLQRRLTAPPTSVRRVRCSPAVNAATPMSATTTATARLTSPISSCVESHQDTHQEAHQKPSAQVTASRGRALRSAARRPRARSHQGERLGCHFSTRSIGRSGGSHEHRGDERGTVERRRSNRAIVWAHLRQELRRRPCSDAPKAAPDRDQTRQLVPIEWLRRE
jgi:hypothetical protein